jgi:hypothetical protein
MLSSTCACFVASPRSANRLSVEFSKIDRAMIARLFCLIPLCVALSCAPAIAQGWDKDKPLAPSVVVDLGTPQVWTMEQAHYLLERNRARDLGLLEQDPSPLNPNDTVGVRAQSLQTLLTGSVSFDQSLGAKNRAASSQFNTQVSQYNTLFKQRDALMGQQAAVSGALAAANLQLTTLQAATTPDTATITAQQTLITQLTAQNSALSSEITSLNGIMGTAPTAPALTTSQPAEESSATALGDNPTFDALVKSLATGPNASKLSASVQLDNYINFQYEMAAKQLTLLRDQVGPNNRVLFLELPHSIYVTDKVHVYPYIGGIWGSYLVQSWWTVGGALQVKPLSDLAIERGAHRAPTMEEAAELNRNFHGFAASAIESVNQKMQKDLDAAQEQRRQKEEQLKKDYEESKEKPRLQGFSPAKSATRITAEEAAKDAALTQQSVELEQKYNTAVQAEEKVYSQELDQLSKRANDDINVIETAEKRSSKALELFFVRSGADPATLKDNPELVSDSYNLLQFLDKVPTDDQTIFEDWVRYWLYSFIPREKGNPGSLTAPIYTLDLIPRQSSYNVTEANTSTHQVGFAGVFGWLSGLGARARYERQKQEFDQFTQVETYATAFGKGDYTFGWTFGPTPGTKEINAGLRTTYAILVVPKDARIVRLNAVGCGYRRRNVPRNPFSLNADELNGDGQAIYGAQHKLDQEDCGTVHTFDIGVPSGDDDFWISDAQYKAVPAGQRVMIRISGRFGDQIGVLVNGTPLQKVPSITQPMLTPAGYAVPANAGDLGTQGVFELVHTRNPKDILGSDIVASFTMPATYTGTPKIMIVSAARDMLVNSATGEDKKRFQGGDHLLDDDVEGPMFYALPAISRVDPTYPDYGNDPKNQNVDLKIVGRGFDTHITSTLVIGTKAYKPYADLKTKFDPSTEYQVIADGAIIEVTADRQKNFPQMSIDYISQSGKQMVDATVTRDDSGGPALMSGCSGVLSAPAKKNNQPVTITLKGSFFSPAVSPTVSPTSKGDDGKPIGAVPHFVSAGEWQIDAQVPTGTTSVQVTLKPSIAGNQRELPCPISKVKK